MATASLPKAEQVLAMPDDGVERELIRGELREKPRTRRNRKHSRATTRVARFLDDWLDTQPEPRGEVVSGEAGFALSRDPDSGVGIDVAYVSADLAVEILSPSDRQEEIDHKMALYLESGVGLVWVLNPRHRTVIVHRPGAEPVLFNASQELTAEPILPGFRVAVADLFGR